MLSCSAGAHKVEISDENIKEKTNKSSFAPYVAIATGQYIDARRLRRWCDNIPEKEFRCTWGVLSRYKGGKEVGAERASERETERTKVKIRGALSD